MDTLDQIIQKMKTQEEVYLQEEVEALIQNKEEAVPKLVAGMENVLENHEDYTCSLFPLYASHILTYLRVKEFFPLLIQLAKLPGRTPYQIFGEETITESFSRFLASVYDGNMELLKETIEDPQVNETIRERVIGSLKIIVAHDLEERETAMDYLKDLLVRQGEEEKNRQIITYCIDTLIDLYPEEAMVEIQWAYEQNLVDRSFVGLHDVERQLEVGRDETLASLKKGKLYQLMGPVDEEMKWWDCFDGADIDREIVNDLLSKLSVAKKAKKKVGRNAPCPCGSGKKYKKCCG